MDLDSDNEDGLSSRSSGSRSSPDPNVENGFAVDDGIERARMYQSETLEAFWQFATTIRRTHSLAAKQGLEIRGEWLTPDLAIQRVHSWGAHSVRLLCVLAESTESRDRLRFFFEKDKLNVAGRLVQNEDPLDSELQVLVKIPFDESLDTWEHERQVLADLADVGGVPQVRPPIFFEDIGIRATTYTYCTTRSLQGQLEAGELLKKEDLHRVASFMLNILENAHERGWLHTDLRPSDVLLASHDVEKATSSQSTSMRSTSIICSWTHAKRVPADMQLQTKGALLQILQNIEVQTSMHSERTGRGSFAAKSFDASVHNKDITALIECLTSTTGPMSVPSMYSAPEQYLALFTGRHFGEPATDIYRVGAVLLMALRARGPLGAFGLPGRPMKRNTERHVTALRHVCQECLMRRSEVEVSSNDNLDKSRPTIDEVHRVRDALSGLLQETVDLSGVGAAELVPWLRKCLARDPGERLQTAQRALDELDEAWSLFEARMLREEKERQATRQAEESLAPLAKAATTLRLKPIVFEPPPELAEMTCL